MQDGQDDFSEPESWDNGEFYPGNAALETPGLSAS